MYVCIHVLYEYSSYHPCHSSSPSIKSSSVMCTKLINAWCIKENFLVSKIVLSPVTCSSGNIDTRERMALTGITIRPQSISTLIDETHRLTSTQDVLRSFIFTLISYHTDQAFCPLGRPSFTQRHTSV